MELKETRRSSTVIDLTSEELLLLRNALNEVCNGVRDLEDDSEFATRLGVSRTMPLIARVHPNERPQAL
jgi:hypothetical protein